MKVSFITIALLLFALMVLAFFQDKDWYLIYIMIVFFGLVINVGIVLVKNIQSKYI